MVGGQLTRVGVWRLLGFQSLLIALVALAFGLVSYDAAVSALLGGLVYLLPACYFAYRVFRYSGARAAKQIVKGFYRGEAIKLLLTILAFALVFKYTAVLPLPFFSAYVVAHLGFWVAPWLLARKKHDQHK